MKITGSLWFTENREPITGNIESYTVWLEDGNVIGVNDYFLNDGNLFKPFGNCCFQVGNYHLEPCGKSERYAKDVTLFRVTEIIDVPTP